MAEEQQEDLKVVRKDDKVKVQVEEKVLDQYQFSVVGE